MSINSLTTFNGVDVNLNVSKDDILAIAVSRYEQDLLAQDKVAEEKFLALDKVFKDKTKEVQNAVTQVGNDNVRQNCLTLIKTLSATGFGNYAWSTISELTDDGIDVYIQIKHAERSYTPALTSRICIVTPDNVTKLLSERDELEEQVRDVCRTRLEIKRNLANIATQERLAKARLAEKVLNGTADGRKLLQALTDGKNGPNVLNLTDNQE